MIITISGKPGSGKSTIAKMIKEKYNLNHYSTGDFFRKRAKELGISFKELTELSKNERHHDIETDNWQKNLGKTEDNFVIDGRLSHKFIEKAIKIYLDVNKEVGALRIMQEKRDEEHALDKEHALKLWQERVNAEHERYDKYYQINIHDLSHYDFVLDTSNLSKEEVFEKVCEFIDSAVK